MIPVRDNITIDEKDITQTFIRASGPGGQNVNKVATAVQLKFDLNRAASLSAPIIRRLKRIAGRKLTEDGFLIIEARRHRTQEQNRKDALDRLIRLVRQAAQPPKPRRKTRPSPAVVRRRIEDKKKRAKKKRLRRLNDFEF